jgi:hypothetical protein
LSYYAAGRDRAAVGHLHITHDLAHADMSHEVTMIKGRRFPTCRHSKGTSVKLAHAARHIGEIDPLGEAHAPTQ